MGSGGGGAVLKVGIDDIQDRGATVYGTGSFENPGGVGKWLQVLQRQPDGDLLSRRPRFPGLGAGQGTILGFR